MSQKDIALLLRVCVTLSRFYTTPGLSLFVTSTFLILIATVITLCCLVNLCVRKTDPLPASAPELTPFKPILIGATSQPCLFGILAARLSGPHRLEGFRACCIGIWWERLQAYHSESVRGFHTSAIHRPTDPDTTRAPYTTSFAVD